MSRGGHPNRMVVIMMIQTNPPPRPKCYSTDELWRDWLVSAHTSGLRVVRRVDTGKSQGNRATYHRLLGTQEIPYCAGCTVGYQRAMSQQGRCHPSPVQVPEEVEA